MLIKKDHIIELYADLSLKNKPDVTIEYKITRFSQYDTSIKTSGTSTVVVKYIDLCDDSRAASLGSYTVNDMVTSVLRPNNEEQSISGEASLTFNPPDTAWPMVSTHNNAGICGDILSSLIHEGKTSQFLTHKVESFPKWISLAPTLQDQIGEYTVKIRHELKEYSNILIEIPFKVTIKGCKIEQFVNRSQDKHETPYTYTPYKSGVMQFDVMKFDPSPACTYTPKL